MPGGAARTAPRTPSPPTTRPHTEVDKHVEFGWAANGISGIETAIGIVLAAVDAGVLPLARAIEALTTGPAAVLGRHGGRALEPRSATASPRTSSSSTAGRRGASSPASLRSKGKNSPLLGRELAGVVRLTIAGGRVAYVR